MGFHIKFIYKLRTVKLSLLALFAIISGALIGQNPLHDAVTLMAQDEDFEYGSLGICIIDLQKDSIVASSSAFSSLIPASSLKVLTTYAALSILGPDYTFLTELQYGGEIVDSTLKGDIFIKGGGDPTLGSPRYPDLDPVGKVAHNFAYQIKKLGIKNIEGSIIGDGSYYDYMPLPNWAWDDIGNYYGAGVHGLNFHDNEFTLYFQKTAAVGEKPYVVKVFPEMPGVSIISDVVSSTPESGDNCYIFGEPYGRIRYANGTIPSGSGRFKVRGSLPNPPQTCAEYLYNTFKDSTHHIKNGPLDYLSYLRTKATPYQRKTFYILKSPPLFSIILQTNHRSINLYAETFIKELGKKYNNISTTANGVKQVYQFWKRKGLNMDGLYLEDGSGLSPRNGVSAYHLSKALSIASRDTLLFPYFYKSLPLAGKIGTVKSFMNGNSSGKVRLKSGSMKRVRSYCGYVESNSKKKYSFSIIANNFTCSGTEVRKKVEELILVLLNQ